MENFSYEVWYINHNNNRMFFSKENTSAKKNNQLLMMCSGENASPEEKAIAQAFSYDIRGEYGNLILEARKKKSEQNSSEPFVWQGNLFCITIEKNEVIFERPELKKTGFKAFVPPGAKMKTENPEEIIEIKVPTFFKERCEIVFKEAARINIETWLEILSEWKKFYLENLGFNLYPLACDSHFFGVLIMINERIVRPSEEISDDSIRTAMQECASRYGLTADTIGKHCKKALAKYIPESAWGTDRKTMPVNLVYDFIRTFFSGADSGKISSDNPVIVKAVETYLSEKEVRKNCFAYLSGFEWL